MAIAVQSTASTNWTGSGSITITKPTGLQVGDMLIAALIANGGINLASGWTQINETSTVFNTNIQYKVADSSDVAASNFTFTCGGSTQMMGALLRVDGYAPTALFSDNETDEVTDSDAGYSFSFTGIAPITTGELFVAALGARDLSATGAGLGSAYAVNGSDPTFTEVVDNSSSIAGLNVHGSVIYGIQTGQTTITTLTATLGNAQSATDYAVTAAFLAPQRNVTGTHSLLAPTPTFNTPTGGSSGISGNADFFSSSPSFTPPTVYTNQPPSITNVAKPSSSWTNPDKP